MHTEPLLIRVIPGHESDANEKATRLLIKAILETDHFLAAIAFENGANRKLTTNFTSDGPGWGANDRDILYEVSRRTRDVDFCKLLIDYGLHNPHNFTPLHIAIDVLQDWRQIYKYIDRDTINQADKRGRTAIHYLVNRGVDEIISNRHQPKQLASSVSRFSVETTTIANCALLFVELHKCGANLSAQPRFSGTTKKGRQESPLRRLILHSSVCNELSRFAVETASLMIDLGVDVEETNRKTSLIDFSVKHGSEAMTNLLKHKIQTVIQDPVNNSV